MTPYYIAQRQFDGAWFDCSYLTNKRFASIEEAIADIRETQRIIKGRYRIVQVSELVVWEE